MSGKTKLFLISLLLQASLSMASCNSDDVYRAPETPPAIAIAVTDAHGSAAEGWQVGGLTAGTYDLEFYTKCALAETQPYVEAEGRMTAVTASENVWIKNVVKGIRVTGGNCSISLKNGSGVMIKDLQLVTSPCEEFSLIKGGDISLLDYVEDNGGKYYDAAGNATDCVGLLADNGMNLARLRLYNDPGNPDFYPSNTLPRGYQDEEAILALAKRAKDKGMKILLSFHYSDYWTNGTDQNKPHAWADLTGEALEKAVYDYTAAFLGRMAAQGTAPEFVAIGNEIQAGLLYPDGACANAKAMCGLLSAASRAVREAAPGARIVVHSDNGGDRNQYKWFFGLLSDYNVDYDIIGASYYPFWTQKKASEIRDWAEYVIDLFDKDILLMETGYAWNATLPDGSAGQLADNGPYNDFTKLGQREFIADLSNQIKQVRSGRLLGYVYWDPIYIAVPGIGWIVGGKNVVSNTTLFGFEGESLPVLDAYKYNN